MRKWRKKTICRLLLLTTLICLFSCNHEQPVAWKAGIEEATDTVSYQQMFGESVHGVLVVKDDVDLKNRKCCLPKGVTLNFQGGVIKNGTLVGDETKIDSYGACFDRVRIQGSWNVPDISTRMFKDMDYDNSLKDVVALASPNVRNKVVIEDGNYQVTALHSNDACLSLGGNTELVVDGVIQMVPNDYEICYVIQAIGDNIAIQGNGTIIGDKHTHTGDTGEWGMGISLRAARHARINGLTIRDCWGDCIYIDDGSMDVKIENCTLDHGRRQGISVVYADGVTIRDCVISNVGGTNPEYAIDVEPDQDKTVDHVTIDRVIVRDCQGGFLVYGYAKDAKVGTVTIRDCNIDGEKKESLAASKCDTLIVENCDIIQHNGWGCVYCRDIGTFVLKGNTLQYDDGLFHHIKDWARPSFGKKRIKLMDIENCGSTKIVQNQKREL